jgi:hypothetical protein
MQLLKKKNRFFSSSLLSCFAYIYSACTVYVYVLFFKYEKKNKVRFDQYFCIAENNLILFSFSSSFQSKSIYDWLNLVNMKIYPLWRMNKKKNYVDWFFFNIIRYYMIKFIILFRDFVIHLYIYMSLMTIWKIR